MKNKDSDKIDKNLDGQVEDKMELKKMMPKFLFIIFINLIVIGIMAFFISPFSKVDTVSVTGNQAVYDQEIIDSSGIKIGTSLIDTFKKLDTANSMIVSDLPQVSKSKAEIIDINNVQIEVEEYDTVAYISQEGSYLRVLENGKILDEEYSVSLGNQPILSKFEEGEALNLMIKELNKLDKSILNLISEIELVDRRSNPLFTRVYMNNGNQVLASIPTFAEKIPYYPEMVQAVEGKKGVFDMEAGVYFVPFTNEKNEDAGTDEEEQQSLEEFDTE